MIGKLIVGASFAGLLTYLTDAGRGLTSDDIILLNIGSLRTAVIELNAEARRSARVILPRFHHTTSKTAAGSAITAVFAISAQR